MDAIAQFFIDWGYIGLFLSALLAGSILPFSSELVLTVLVQMGADPTVCLISASIGNTIGGLICYWLGYLGDMQKIERWLKIDHTKMERVDKFVRKYGAWMGGTAFMDLELFGGKLDVIDPDRRRIAVQHDRRA